MQTGRSNCDEYLMRGRNISLFNLHQHKDSGEQSNSTNSTECPSLAGSAAVFCFKRLTIQDLLQTNTEMRHLYFSPEEFFFFFF